MGGDPCGEKWQGVECVFSNITAMYVNSIHSALANLVFSVNNGTIICFCQTTQWFEFGRRARH